MLFIQAQVTAMMIRRNNKDSQLESLTLRTFRTTAA